MKEFKFWVSIAIVLIAVVLQINLAQTLNWSPDFVLVSLITLGFFLSLNQLLVCVLLAMLLLNFGAGLSPEIIWLGATPILLFFFRHFTPWQNWLNNLNLTLVGIVIFYLASQLNFGLFRETLFYLDLAISGFIASVLFLILRQIMGYPRERRMFSR